MTGGPKEAAGEGGGALADAVEDAARFEDRDHAPLCGAPCHGDAHG